MSQINYDVQKDSWYSPIEVINHFEKLRSVYKSAVYDNVFKKAHEMFVGAVSLLGAYELSPENKYFMQINRQAGSPDVMAAKQIENGGKGILLELNQMEITEFEDHFKSDDIVEFLKSTKILPKRDYGEDFLIICAVNKNVPIDYRKIHEMLLKLQPKSTIYIIGRPVGVEFGNFSIFCPFPILTKPIKFNIDRTAAKYSIPERVQFSLGIEEKISYKAISLNPVNTYDILGLDRNRIYKKFGVIDKL